MIYEESFYCSIFDLLSKHGFMEGHELIPEEEPLVEKACEYLVSELGIIDQRWQPIISRADQHYVLFFDTLTQKYIHFYDMDEKDKRKINAIVDKKNLSWIQVNDNLECSPWRTRTIETRGTSKTTEDKLTELIASLVVAQKETNEEMRRNSAEIKQFMQKTDEQISRIEATVEKVSKLLGNA